MAESNRHHLNGIPNDHQQDQTTSTATHDSASEPSSSRNADDAKKKRTGPKRRKVTHACVYCRRSHMTCDEGRPCQRCIKRSIGHLCHDEPKNPNGSAKQTAKSKQAPTSDSTNNYMLNNLSLVQDLGVGNKFGGLPLQFFGQMGTGQLTFASEHMGNEISVISNFLDSVGGNVPGFYNQHGQGLLSSSVNTTEKFFLTAADPSDGRLEDRLTEVINAKYEAGFLKPYNYVNGYARLQKYMDNNMSASSRQRILNVMGTFRPAFRSVAQSLTDIDLILVEEAFERLLLDYDRVFSSMGIPACLWRRTGEIYKGNKEFASLVNVPIEQLREGRLCIYELMAEESAVNYWEKYGNIAFDPGQKAVLTSCLLKNPEPTNTSVISCCFSFTIRRDKYNIPTVIVGNFLPVQLQ
ncbi:uncharacterized protein BYT42DRAFT_588323 [Radiomyces spectabilis]|uniref:uncharacterized protein n=1 Tax=Radiomyces spectabilis TaxID=64574 RepID=UPI0022208003|nr:uncharacterized protein BYT42DRAFT_588323 [Radiomyces spectabilis]KAI8365942.1 hypothetical protein BYT42DRAFT_588323 [Radiomyces spectabilis]